MSPPNPTCSLPPRYDVILPKRLRGKPTPDAFAAMFLQALDKADVKDAVYDTENFRIMLTDDGSTFINLSNFHRDYCRLRGKARREVIPRAIRGFTQGTGETDDDLALTAEKSFFPGSASRAIWKPSGSR